jgi:dUTP pyrophosphatase
MSQVVRLGVLRLPPALDLPLPARASAGSAGLDLRAALAQPLELRPGERAAVPTGLVLAVPAGYEGQVRARSGNALREGLAVINGPGTIDADYRGEVRVLLVNLGQEAITIAHGDRIAQLVIAPVPEVSVDELCTLDELGETERGAGGFGSTGRS